MKILIVNHFPLEGSGSGTYTKNLAMFLAKHGNEVAVVLPENEMNFPRPEGVHLHPVFFTPESGEAPTGALPFNFPCFTTHPRSNNTFAKLTDEQLDMYCDAFRTAIAEEVERFQPDVIHGQHVWILPTLAPENVPLVVTAHGTDLMGYSKWAKMRGFAEEAMRRARKVIVISKDNQALVEQAFHEYSNKTVYMRNGYNPMVFHPMDVDRAELIGSYGLPYNGEEVVLFAGKLTYFKGVDILLEAAKTYTKLNPNTITIIAGHGELRSDLEHQRDEAGLDSVHFIGNVSQDNLSLLYNIADVDLVPSRREAFGLVAVEAMACGTPVIATNEGGLPDFVNNEVGALVDPESPDSLAAGVVSTLARVKADPEWGKRIYEYAEGNFSQERMIEELENLYREVAGE